MTAHEIITTAESWSKSNPDNHAAVVLRDNKNTYIHYAGTPSEIAKGIVALMAEDAEIAVAIFGAVTVTAYKSFPEEVVNGITAASRKIADLRRDGATDADVERIMLGK